MLIVNNSWFFSFDFSRSFVTFRLETLQIEMNVTKEKDRESNEFFSSLLKIL
jgi:hypothetical protein